MYVSVDPSPKSSSWIPFVTQVVETACFAGAVSLLSYSQNQWLRHIPEPLRAAAPIALGGATAYALHSLAEKCSKAFSKALDLARAPVRDLITKEALVLEEPIQPAKKTNRFKIPFSFADLLKYDPGIDSIHWKQPLESLKKAAKKAIEDANSYELSDEEAQEALTTQNLAVRTAHSLYSLNDDKAPYNQFTFVPNTGKRLEPKAQWSNTLSHEHLMSSERTSFGDHLPYNREEFKSSKGKHKDFYFGGCEAIGDKPFMEDFGLGTVISINGVDYPLFGVFDGHGHTDGMSYYAYDNCETFLQEELQKRLEVDNKTDLIGEDTIICNALRATLVRIHKTYDPDQKEEGGTTANIGLVVGNDLFVANCGDSRMILTDCNGEIQTLSEDATGNNPRHQKIIELNGGILREHNSSLKIFRKDEGVEGFLSPGSALGDYNYIGSNPTVDITKTTLDRSKDWLALSFTDGVSDVVTPNLLGDALFDRMHIQNRARKSEQALAEDIIYSCLQQPKSADNMSVVILKIPKLEDAAT